jgi:hypothetical protein
MESSIQQFACPAGWRVSHWDPGIQFPKNGFVIGGDLLIGIESEGVCSLFWLDADGSSCQAHGLAFNPMLRKLNREGGTVFFGILGCPCDSVTVSLDGYTLTGTLQSTNAGDGNSGTFAATANPVPPQTGYS